MHFWHPQRQWHLQQEHHALLHADTLAPCLGQQLLLPQRQLYLLGLALRYLHTFCLLQRQCHVQPQRHWRRGSAGLSRHGLSMCLKH